MKMRSCGGLRNSRGMGNFTVGIRKSLLGNELGIVGEARPGQAPIRRRTNLHTPRRFFDPKKSDGPTLYFATTVRLWSLHVDQV